MSPVGKQMGNKNFARAGNASADPGHVELDSSSVVLLDDHFYLKVAGRISLTLFKDSLTWHRVEDGKKASCLDSAACVGLAGFESPCLLKDIYGVEILKEQQEVKTKGPFSKPMKMYGFMVHTYRKESSKWVPRELRFLHADEQECRSWVAHLESLLSADPERPHRLLVFVNPYGGHRQGIKRWEACKPIFDRAGITLDLVVTTHRNHAYDIMHEATIEQLMGWDGIVVVGGDGFFNEVLNGLCKRHHLAPPCRRPRPRGDFPPPSITRTASTNGAFFGYSSGTTSDLSSPAILAGTTSAPANLAGIAPAERARDPSFGPPPVDLDQIQEPQQEQQELRLPGRKDMELDQLAAHVPETITSPLATAVSSIVSPHRAQIVPSNDATESLSVSPPQKQSTASHGANCTPEMYRAAPIPEATEHAGPQEGDDGQLPSLEQGEVGLDLQKKIRIGIIPAGSTDCIAMSATGSRDPVTAALHIALGERMPLDVVRLTTWGHGELGVPPAALALPVGPIGAASTSGGRSSPTSTGVGPTGSLSVAVSQSASAERKQSQYMAESLKDSGSELTNLASCPENGSGGSLAAGQGVTMERGQAQGMPGASGAVLSPERAMQGNGAVQQSEEEDRRVQYACSFIGYGFYGDVARHSEELRWMGPARYDYAGFLTYMRHRSYDAEVSYLHMPEEEGEEETRPAVAWHSGGAHAHRHHKHKHRNKRQHTAVPEGSERSPSERAWDQQVAGGSGRGRGVCTMGCMTCANGRDFSRLARASAQMDDAEGEADASVNRPSGSRQAALALGSSLHARVAQWRTVLGAFHSVGAAVVSCRNEKAPDGVAAHAHLADGHLHLILIRRCSRPQYLLQLLRLTWKGADPLDFKFVEHHKTPAFTFIAHGRRSLWNVDGELLDAKEVSGQVFRGLVDLFASGPEC